MNRCKGVVSVGKTKPSYGNSVTGRMSKILTPSSGPDDWQQFLADPQKQWKRGYSAMAAALSWEAAKGLPPEIAALLGPDVELLFAIPEHKVALPGGRQESQCDVFALARAGDETIALAVEAKVNEPFAPTVREWMVGASAVSATPIPSCHF